MYSSISSVNSTPGSSNDKNSLFEFGHRDRENSGRDCVPAPIGTPKQLSGGSRLAKEPHFDQTVSENGLLCQPEVGFQAELDVGSSRREGFLH